MEQLRLATGCGAVAKPGPARLEVGEAAARRDLPVTLHGREPDLDVVLTGGRGAEVADGDVDHAIR